MSRKRVGFLGVGWIGQHRMKAMLGTDAIDAVAVVDPSPEMAEAALKLAPGVRRVDTFEAMLAMDLDGVVIATPSARHAEQSIRALQAGAAVFCQKPLGRNAAEAAAVVEAARAADRLLSVDFCYRLTAGAGCIRDLIQRGELGSIFAIDLTFHNAYGPDKPWFYDKAQSGGGCMMDLGVHLIDLVLWLLDFPRVVELTSHLFANGRPLYGGEVEDCGVATMILERETVVRIACSWRLHAGRDAVIEASFYGTQAGATLRNIGGSFYDFTAERLTGTARTVLATPPDAWGGRAAAQWAQRLATDHHFDPDADHLVAGAEVLDRIYAPRRGSQTREGD